MKKFEQTKIDSKSAPCSDIYAVRMIGIEAITGIITTNFIHDSTGNPVMYRFLSGWLDRTQASLT